MNYNFTGKETFVTENVPDGINGRKVQKNEYIEGYIIDDTKRRIDYIEKWGTDKDGKEVNISMGFIIVDPGKKEELDTKMDKLGITKPYFVIYSNAPLAKSLLEKMATTTHIIEDGKTSYKFYVTKIMTIEELIKEQEMKEKGQGATRK